jgi:hypothetical protein
MLTLARFPWKLLIVLVLASSSPTRLVILNPKLKLLNNTGEKSQRTGEPPQKRAANAGP